MNNSLVLDALYESTLTGWEYGPAPTRVYATTRTLYVAPVVKLFNITDIVVAFSVICARTLLELPAFTWNERSRKKTGARNTFSMNYNVWRSELSANQWDFSINKNNNNEKHNNLIFSNLYAKNRHATKQKCQIAHSNFVFLLGWNVCFFLSFVVVVVVWRDWKTKTEHVNLYCIA